ncbi:MAG TPA: HAMP domain-containing sensor histidine kinase [Thermoclostridium sp.]|nr:HAMP domain-containing sensor histidine kinase [Thermoclostridium sp.]
MDIKLKDKQFRTTLTRKIIIKCVITLIISTLIYALFFGAIFFIGHSVITWYTTPLYHLLKTVEKVLIVSTPIAWMIMVLVIIYYYWRRTVGFIDDVAVASVSLVQPDDEDIRLPQELREIEDKMNQIKRTARQNERDAKEAERRKNDLVVNIAHDIRTPLSSVIGYLSLLSEAPDIPIEQRIKYTDITLEKAQRLEQLVEEFFEITRFNVSSTILNYGKINLSFMLQQLADEFYPMLSPQNKQAVVHAPDDLVLWGDADKLSRVFNNIMKNAIAYSYNDSVIDITAFEQEENTVIQFKNKGDPIPKQKLDTIFERFFRLNTARSSGTGGSGLGLAIAKEIVVAHDGTVEAQSDKTQTTFTVTLPTRMQHDGTIGDSNVD